MNSGNIPLYRQQTVSTESLVGQTLNGTELDWQKYQQLSKN